MFLYFESLWLQHCVVPTDNGHNDIRGNTLINTCANSFPIARVTFPAHHYITHTTGDDKKILWKWNHSEWFVSSGANSNLYPRPFLTPVHCLSHLLMVWIHRDPFDMTMADEDANWCCECPSIKIGLLWALEQKCDWCDHFDHRGAIYMCPVTPSIAGTSLTWRVLPHTSIRTIMVSISISFIIGIIISIKTITPSLSRFLTKGRIKWCGLIPILTVIAKQRNSNQPH